MPTILDILNEDCWRLVLDFVDYKDIIRSERVCRAWQQVVLQYFRGIGPGFAIKYPWYGYDKTHFRFRELIMVADDPERFRMLTGKWGPCIKKADCINDASLAVLRKNCPNLEVITLHSLHNLTSGSLKTFKKMKRVHFRGCDSITDNCVKHWIVNCNIEELVIWQDEVLTGRCFATTHSTKLKTICLYQCESLDYRHFLAAADHFKQLRKLELQLVPKEIFENVHTLLDKLQDLEDLALGWKERFDLSVESAESVGRLRLRRLDVSFNPNITDEWLEKACCGFGRLEELVLERCVSFRILQNMPTILDILNEDCWRLVLDFVDYKDIIRSERVCRAWQQVVLQYFRGIGPGFAIKYPWYGYDKTHFRFRELIMVADDPERFRMLTGKWGPCIKKADCINDASLAVLRKNCPNLEVITLHSLHNLTSGSLKTFKKMKRVHFRGCDSITDNCVKHWIVNCNIEELVIWQDEVLTGRCFATTHSTKLKTICLYQCESLDYRHFLAAADHFKQLRKLELQLVPKEIFENVHTLLDKLQDLEDLALGWKERFDLSVESAESVGRLRLRRLDVSFNPNITDEWLEKACCGFGRLEELVLERCVFVSARGVAAACGAARATLRGLHVGSNRKMEDQHVEQFVRMCPNLMWLDVSYCDSITDYVTEKVGNARSHCSLKPVTLKLERRGAV